MTWDDRDIYALERILIRAKASAISDRNDAQRLYGAYGDRRAAIDQRIDEAVKTITDADRLLMLARTLRSGSLKH